MRALFKNKISNDRMCEGLVSEFITHVILNYMGFKQECLFTNLEENSAKKGFDGLYSTNGTIWIMESKSSSSSTHKKVIDKAYNSLKERISNEGRVTNSPWQNALYHAKQVDSSADIVSKLKELDKQFDEGMRIKTSQFDVIPSATIINPLNIID